LINKDNNVKMKPKSEKKKKEQKKVYKTSGKVEYITDTNGKKRKVILPIKTYETLLEDLHDLSVVADRKSEKTIDFKEVLKELKKDGLL
jgi:hypothetical protein